MAIDEQQLAEDVARAWGETRQVDITLTSGDVLRGTALIPGHTSREVTLFGVQRRGLPVASAVLRLEEIASVATADEPADSTLGLLPDGDGWVADPSWSYSAGDGRPAFGSALSSATSP